MAYLGPVLGRTYLASTRNDYTSTSVTTGAYVQLFASAAVTNAVNIVEIFDSSGQTLELGVDAAGGVSYSRVALIVPGGNGQINLRISSGSSVAVRAVSATANTGEIDVNLYV